MRSRDADRLYLYGYRYGEVVLDPLPAVVGVMSTAREVDLSRRPPVAVSLGCHAEGFALPHPDNHDPRTTQAGVRKRFMCKPPDADEALLEELTAFVAKQLVKHFVPLDANQDTTFEGWIPKTNYAAWRKAELEKVWEDFRAVTNAEWKRLREDAQLKKFRECKSFMKDEHYIAYKAARGINSRHDLFKCQVGPIFKLIEGQVFHNRSFIKYIPVAERPKYINEMLQGTGQSVIATDYSTFEALFTPALMRAVEFQLYDYMTSKLPEHEWFMTMCNEVLAGENVCKYKHFSTRIEGKRMSGEMCTSLGNGFSNLMFTRFMCKKAGCKKVRGVVEGDDGLFTMIGTPPKSEDFLKLGLVIKLERHEELNKASFCGLIFDNVDFVNISDPRKVLASFGWTSARYAMSHTSKLKMLLRAKSMSLAAQYPGCPILSALADYGLRMTADVNYDRLAGFIANARFNEYEREKLREGIALFNKNRRKVSYTARELMAEVFGVDVVKQEEIEQYLASLTEICPLRIDLGIHKDWLDYYDRYSYVTDRRDPVLCFPPHSWREYADFKPEW